MFRSLLFLTFAIGALNLGVIPQPAFACPMCSQANESGSNDGEAATAANLRPKAYMYSILFMLAMPATLLAGFGLGFYRLAKRHAAEQELLFEASDSPEDAKSDPH